MDPLGGTVIIFAQSLQVLGVQALNRHLVVELVHKGVIHDIRDPFLLVSWVSLSRLEQLENFSVETVIRNHS